MRKNEERKRVNASSLGSLRSEVERERMGERVDRADIFLLAISISENFYCSVNCARTSLRQ